MSVRTLVSRDRIRALGRRIGRRRRHGVDPELADRLVERAYRSVLGRAPDAEGRRRLVDALVSGRSTIPEMGAALASSPEFVERLDREAGGANGSAPGDEGVAGVHDPEFVDVRELIATTSIDDLLARAEDYFRTAADPEVLLAKPYKDPQETPELLVNFGQVLRGLDVVPGMRVLDFGVGTCWTSRALTQLGCAVVAVDVSASALDLGRELYRRHPVFGAAPEPEFVVFDGRRLAVDDASVDRVLCFDALHHVPNPSDVIAEIGRVLRPGGIAAFSEPGPHHSTSPQSQYEMRHHGVIENDIVLEEIWGSAREAGFVDVRVCLLDTAPPWVDLETFSTVVAGLDGPEVFDAPTRASIATRRTFLLRREGDEQPDSRVSSGLVADLSLDVEVTRRGDRLAVTGSCRAVNTGTRRWLPSTAPVGPVLLGVRARRDAEYVDAGRVGLPGDGVDPGGEVTFPVSVDVADPGASIDRLEFDLVSERICWFSVNGSRVVQVDVD